MEGRVLVAGESDESDLAVSLGLIEGLQHAALGIRQVGVVVVDDSVDLPQVEVIGLQPPQRLLEHTEGQRSAPAVRADLGHQEDLVPTTLERPAEDVLGSKKVTPASTASWTSRIASSTVGRSPRW